MTTSNRIMESEVQPDTGQSNQWAWTSGRDRGVEHIKKINDGAFGEVHKVHDTAYGPSNFRCDTKKLNRSSTLSPDQR